ncbi:MAG: hypothetical protein V8S95_11770 [Odoribacter sp.]
MRFSVRLKSDGAAIGTPQFWVPILKLSEFRRDFAPKTSISLSYSQEHTQFYRRREWSVPSLVIFGKER